MSHPPYSPDLNLSDCFFVSLGEKSSQRETFCDMEEVKWKTNKQMQKHWKASRLTGSKPTLSSGKKVSIGVLHQMESALKMTED